MSMVACPRVTDAVLAYTATDFPDRISLGPASHHQQAPQARHRQPSASHRTGSGHRETSQIAEGQSISAGMPSAAPATAPDLPVELIDIADLPDGGQLKLLRQGSYFSIRFGSEELMGNRVRHSEEALAVLGCRHLVERGGRVLIGGLGMGFTLGAALDTLPPHARIVVAELIPKVVAWADGPLSHIFGAKLSDPRVSIEMGDVHDVIVRETDGFDAILLDVDNGPDGLIHLPNERLYCNWGLRAAYAALKPGGILTIWSAYRDPAFVERLTTAGFDVDEISIDAYPGEDNGNHTIWIAARREPDRASGREG
jgi:spermidine synthase